METSMSFLLRPILLANNMVFNVTENLTSDTDSVSSSKPNLIRFYVLLVCQIASCLASLRFFYHFVRVRSFRQSLHNHGIALLVVINFLFDTIPLPMSEFYFMNSIIKPSTNLTCAMWNWIHYSLNMISVFLMSFICFERYLFVFYSNMFHTKWKRVAFHYLPYIFCIVYPTVFYFVFIFLWSCESYYDVTELLCYWPCYFDNLILASYDLFINNCLPLFLIPIFCALLFVRLIAQRRQMKRQAFKWKRDRKITLQLLAISSLYLILWIPMEIVVLLCTYFIRADVMDQLLINYFFLFPYFVNILNPLLCLVCYPEILRRNRRVQPVK